MLQPSCALQWAPPALAGSAFFLSDSTTAEDFRALGLSIARRTSDITKSNRDIATAYIRALESGATGDDIAEFFSPDAVVTEFPNRFTPNGGTRDLENLLAAAERGKKVMQHDCYEPF